MERRFHTVDGGKAKKSAVLKKENPEAVSSRKDSDWHDVPVGSRALPGDTSIKK